VEAMYTDGIQRWKGGGYFESIAVQKIWIRFWHCETQDVTFGFQCQNTYNEASNASFVGICLNLFSRMKK